MNEYKRICPECNKELLYKTPQGLRIATNENRLCRSCSKRGERNVMKRQEVLDKFRGENNPMSGKSLYEHWLSKYGKDEADRRYVTHAKNSVPNNNAWSKPIYEIWIEKYGKERADELRIKKYKKASASLSGKNNPMFGKPAPVGSGNGWSGWFRGIFFRSILELSYLKFLIDNDIKFESGELSKHRIIINEDKSYFPDFYLIETCEIIEVKPKALIHSKLNEEKFTVAKKVHGKKFIVITEEDIEVLTTDKLRALRISGELKFTRKYEEQFTSSFPF